METRQFLVVRNKIKLVAFEKSFLTNGKPRLWLLWFQSNLIFDEATGLLTLPLSKFNPLRRTVVTSLGSRCYPGGLGEEEEAITWLAFVLVFLQMTLPAISGTTKGKRPSDETCLKPRQNRNSSLRWKQGNFRLYAKK